MTSRDCVGRDPNSYCYARFCSCVTGTVLENDYCVKKQFCVRVSFMHVTNQIRISASIGGLRDIKLAHPDAVIVIFH